jgi:formamidopyrimidine-DNA glycosylase
MTGAIRTLGDDPIVLETSAATVDRAWPPRFCKLHLAFDDGARLGFVNARRLGRIRLRDEPLKEPPISKLGFDPLLDLPGKTEFAERVRRRRTPIKALLLDQKFAAGVGNWIADEVLFQARIRPRRRADKLRLYEIEALRVAIGEVVRIAVSVDARKDAFPADWLFHRRWGKQKNATTLGGDRIRHDQIGGRTTAWVPDVQR